MCANGKIGNRKQLPSIKWLDLHSPVKARKQFDKKKVGNSVALDTSDRTRISMSTM